jgi:site-specific recombinase XerC
LAEDVAGLEDRREVMSIDCKLRGCDLVCLKVNDVYAAGRVKERASVTQSKTRKPVRFEITDTTRASLERWIKDPEKIGCEYLWPSRLHASPHLSTRQYARIMRDWVLSIGLKPSASGTHLMRRTKAAQIYKKTGNLRAVQLLLGHTKMDSTVRYLGVAADACEHGHADPYQDRGICDRPSRAG